MMMRNVMVLLAVLLTQQLFALEVSVQPDKIRVKPGESVRLLVQVHPLPAGQIAEVTCLIQTGLAEEVSRQTAPTDATGAATFTFTPKAEWGYGVTVTAKAGGETATGYDVFACAKNPYMVQPMYNVAEVYGQDTLPDGTPAPRGAPQNPWIRQAITEQVARMRREYVTVAELMGPAFCSFSSIVPPVDNYFKGWHYNYSRNGVVGLIDALHANGISSVMYVNACLSGLAGTEFARKHPEYLAYNADGTPCAEVSQKYMAAHQAYVRDYPKGLPAAVVGGPARDTLCQDYPGFLNALQDFRDITLSEIGARAILDGKAYFGYDGVRYDGHYCVPSIGDPLAPTYNFRNYQGEPQPSGEEGVKLTARNMKRAYALMRKDNPNFLIGLNFADYRGDQAGDRAITSPVGKVTAPGMWILDECAKDSLDPTSTTHKWADFILFMGEEADRVRKVDNFLFAGWGGGPGHKALDTKQILAVSYADGVRWICGGYKPADNGEAKHQYAQFAYRYGEFILNNKLQRLPTAEVAKRVTVTGSHPLLWDHFVYQLQTPHGRYLVMHLINKPLEDGITAEATAPPAVTDVQVTLANTLCAGAAVTRATVLTPDAAATATSVPVQGADGTLSLTVPTVTNWTIVVLPY